MTDNKMSDAEIIKALPTVAYGGHSCNECKYKHEKGECRCGLKGCRITREAIDLINRKDAEIERYKANEKFINEKCDSILEKTKKIPYALKMDVARAKSEAYKEFAERFKEKASSAVTSCQGYEIYETKQYQISAVGLDNLLKELTESK